MTFGYTLLGGLLLLLPGFAAYLGQRLGETGLVSPRPDQPSSTLTIFIVVFFALLFHAIGAGLFALNEFIAHSHHIVTLAYDPNPYRMLWAGKAPRGMSGIGFAWDLLYLVLLTVAAGAVTEWMSRRIPITAISAPLRFGWLLPIAKQVEAGSHVVIGYVLTTTGHDGAWIAYEGIVRRLALDDDDAIQMIVLEQCDRFVVRIIDGKVERVDSDADTIALIQLRDKQIANYALEVLEVMPPA